MVGVTYVYSTVQVPVLTSFVAFIIFIRKSQADLDVLCRAVALILLVCLPPPSLIHLNRPFLLKVGGGLKNGPRSPTFIAH